MNAALHFDRVSKAYGRVQVLDTVSFAVPAGQCVALVGLNGAGKTTLVKCLLDFCGMEGGTITINGIDHADSASRAALSYLPERFAPPGFLTGREFLRTMAELSGVAFQDAALPTLEARLGLAAGAMNRPIRELSKGMTQKIGFASVLMNDKPIWILDEPMSGLDPQARALVKAALAAARQAGKTVLMTSHELADVEQLCDRLVIIHERRLRADAPPASLKAAHAAADLEQAFLAAIGHGSESVAGVFSSA